MATLENNAIISAHNLNLFVTAKRSCCQIHRQNKGGLIYKAVNSNTEFPLVA